MKILFLLLGMGVSIAGWSETMACAGAKSFNVHDVRAYGAKGDGVAKDTVAIQRAIDAVERAGGGEVFLGAGVYLSGSIFLKDNVDFHLGPGAVLKGSPDPSDYAPYDIWPWNWMSVAEKSSGCHLVWALEKCHVTVRGPGKIDGNALHFSLDRNGKPYPRQANIPWRPGQMLYFAACEDLRITDLELADAPYWNCFMIGCTGVAVRGLYIHSLRGDKYSHNGDGLDIDCCQHVTVSDCRINTSDDCIAIRADGKHAKNPQDCAYITVMNCTLSTDKCAIRMGVGGGFIHDVAFNNIVVSDTRTAVSFCPNWTKEGGSVGFRNCRFANFAVDCKTFCRMLARWAKDIEIADIVFDGFSGRVTEPAYVFTQPDCPVKNVVFRNIQLPMGVETYHTDGVKIEGGTLKRIESSPERLEELRRMSETRNYPHT